MTEREIAEIIRWRPSPLDSIYSGACRELYQLLRRRFLSFLSRGTSAHAGEDMLHEIYGLTLDAIAEDRIEDLDAIAAYAYGIARKVRARALERQAQRMRKVISIDSFRGRDEQEHDRDPLPDPEHGLIEREAAAELAAIFQQLLADMNPLDRRLIERFYILGHKPAAIAADYGQTPGAFERRMYRIRQKLKAAYQRINRMSPEEGGPYKDAA